MNEMEMIYVLVAQMSVDMDFDFIPKKQMVMSQIQHVRSNHARYTTWRVPDREPCRRMAVDLFNQPKLATEYADGLLTIKPGKDEKIYVVTSGFLHVIEHMGVITGIDKAEEPCP